METTYSVFKKGYNKCLLFIIEDDKSISENYMRIADTSNADKDVLERIECFTDDIDFKAVYKRPDQNVVFIVDFQLHKNAEKGISKGINVLNLIVGMGNNPVFVITAYHDHRELRPFREKYPQIEIIEKKSKMRPDIEAVLKKSREYINGLNRNTLEISIDACYDNRGHDVLEEFRYSAEKMYEYYFLNDSGYILGKHFLAKCFLNTPMPFERELMFNWETKDLSCTGSIISFENAADESPSFSIIKRYNAGKLVAIAIGKDRTKIEFYNTETFKLMLEDLKLASLTALERIIIDHFVVSRIADLWLEHKLPGTQAITLLRAYDFTDKQIIFERTFIANLWEKKMKESFYDTKRTNECLKEFYRYQFPEVADVFYCKVNDKLSEETEFVSVEIKSADSPGEVFLREYPKKFFPIHFIRYQKTFKLTYYYSKSSEDSSVSFTFTPEEILPEEFNYLTVEGEI